MYIVQVRSKNRILLTTTHGTMEEAKESFTELQKLSLSSFSAGIVPTRPDRFVLLEVWKEVIITGYEANQERLEEDGKTNTSQTD